MKRDKKDKRYRTANQSGKSGKKVHPSRIGRPGPAFHFRQAFDALWTKLFTSPVHLDSAISQASPGVKAPLAEISRLLLQRPRSIAHYLRFQLSEEEPWWLDQETLASWPTAREMAKRL